jgi:hypothetical protein
MLAWIFPYIAPLLGAASPVNWLTWLITTRLGRHILLGFLLAGGALYGAHRLVDHGREMELAKVEAARVAAEANAKAAKAASIAADDAQRQKDADELAALRMRIADLEKAPAPVPPAAAPATTYKPSAGCDLSGAQRKRLRDAAGSPAPGKR